MSLATTSSKFAFINVASGTPTASISAGTPGAAFLTATGNLQTTARQALTLGGGTANTYSGTTYLNEGVLSLAKSAGVAIAGPLVIGDSAGTDTVRLNGANQFGTGAVTINSSAGKRTFARDA